MEMEGKSKESIINTFVPILQQSLANNDAELFDQCMEIKNKKVITGIIKKILKTEVILLTKKVISSIEKEPTKGNQIAWLRTILIVHTPLLLKYKEIVFKLEELYNKIQNGNKTVEKMLQLSGRLDMINVQLSLRNSDAFDLELNEEENFSSDEDEDNDEDKEEEYNMYEDDDDEDDDDEEDEEDDDDENENKEKNKIVDDVFGVTDFSFLNEIKK